MISLKLQPTFSVRVPGTADEAVKKLRGALETAELRGAAVSAGRVIDFKIAKAEQRFWSPHLSVQVGEVDSGELPLDTESCPAQAELFARFSPRPEIYTMVIAIYFSTAVIMSGALIYAYVQWFMGDPAWALLAIPIGITIIAGLHLASVIGQSLSSDQMDLLRTRLDCAVDLAFPGENVATPLAGAGANEASVAS
jgi:hypothetical protein